MTHNSPARSTKSLPTSGDSLWLKPVLTTQEVMVSIERQVQVIRKLFSRCSGDSSSYQMALYELRAAHLTVRFHHQENFCTTVSWEQLSQPSSYLHTTVKQIQHHSKPAKITVGMILIPRRSQSCFPPSKFEYRLQMLVGWRYGVVKSKAETPWSHVVQTPQDESRRNRLQLKEAAKPTTVLVSTSTSSTATSTTVQPTIIPLCTNDVLTEPLSPIKKLSNDNKSNSNVSVECAPETPKCESGGKSWNQGT